MSVRLTSLVLGFGAALLVGLACHGDENDDSCEAADIGDHDESTFCQEEAHPAFGCRSTGGGSANRKVCVP